MIKRYTKLETDNLKKIDGSFRADINLVKIHKNNTLAHEMAKCEIAYVLLKAGHSFICEARFKNGNRGDLYDLTSDELYEVETKQVGAKERKEGLYPVSWVTIIDPSKSVSAQIGNI